MPDAGQHGYPRKTRYVRIILHTVIMVQTDEQSRPARKHSGNTNKSQPRTPCPQGIFPGSKIMVKKLFTVLLIGLLAPTVIGCDSNGPRITLPPTLTPSPMVTDTPTTTWVVSQSATPTCTAAPSPTPSPTFTPLTHVVQKGEVLGKIAGDYSVSLQSLIEANGLQNPNQLSIGQSLIIPVATNLPNNNSESITATPQPTPSEIPSDRVVFITMDGQEYHLEDCPLLKGEGIPITCQEAVSLGYVRCKHCAPKCW